MTTRLRFGILGAARIAPHGLIRPAQENQWVAVVAIAARDAGRAREFAAKHDIPRSYGSYEELLADPQVDAVYVALPIGLHCEPTLAALAAGKHVLCEKTLAANASEAQRMADAAADSGQVLMEAFHYRYHPVMQRARAIVQSGILGALEQIEAQLTVPFPESDIRYQYALGGGVTIDVGCYPLHAIRHLTDEEPDVVSAAALKVRGDIDVALRAQLRLPSGAAATVFSSMDPDVSLSAHLTVRGSIGTLHVESPFAPHRGHMIRLESGDEAHEETLELRPTFSYQLEAFVSAVVAGVRLPTGADDAVLNMRLIDAVYRAAGLPVRGDPDRLGQR